MNSTQRLERIELLKKQASLLRPLALKGNDKQLAEYYEVLKEIEKVQRMEAGFRDIMVFAKNYFTGAPPHDLLKADTPSPPFHYELAAYLRESVLDPMERKTAIAAPRSHAKCLSGDSIIYTIDGRKKLIDINVGDLVQSMDHDVKMTFNRVSNKWESGIKEVYQVTTKSGHKITTTLDHRFYTMDGYKRLGELKTKDNIAITRTLANLSMVDKPVHEVRFVAYMIAEGALSSGNCRFTNADPVIVNDFIDCTTKMGFNVRQTKKYEYVLTGGARLYFREQGLFGHTAKTKRIPEWVFSLSPQLKAEFLSAFWDTDGFIARQAGTIGITLANSELIDDIREILLSLGIQSRKCYRYNKLGFHSWGLSIADRENILKFHELINLKLKQPTLEELVNKVTLRKPHPTNDGIPPEWRKHLSKSAHFYRETYSLRVDNKYKTSREKLQTLVSFGHEDSFLTDLANSDIFWDEILSIEFVGEQMTYDIEVENTHNFVANAFVVHNSTLATAIFPIWCICYVEDVNERYWVIIGDKQDNAKKFLDTIKSEFEDNDLLKADFGELKGSTWNALEIITQNSVKISAHGAQEGLRGLRYGSFRPSVIMDDIESEDSCSTPERIAKMIDWFDRTVLPLGDPKHSKFYLIGTVIHYNSVLNQVINERPDWKAFKYRAIEQYPTNMHLWTEFESILNTRDEGDTPMEAARIAHDKAMDFYKGKHHEMNDGAKVLWPERLDLLSLMYKRSTRRVAFLTEYMNEPVDADTRTFQKIWYYKTEDINMDDLDIYGACDPALGKSKRADPSVIFTLGRHRKTGILYVLDVDNRQRSAEQLIKDIFIKATTFNYMAFNIETIAFQQFFKDEVMKRSAQQNIYLPVKEFKSTVKKEIRIASLEPLVSSGQIRMLSTQRDLEEQMLFFPRGKDDILDGLVMAVDLAKGKSSGFTFGKL